MPGIAAYCLTADLWSPANGDSWQIVSESRGSPEAIPYRPESAAAHPI
jgi:hypothetical protein